jgi:hypothetical protein
MKMNRLTRIAGILVGVVVLATSITGVSAAASGNRVAVDPQIAMLDARDLTEAEADGVLFMREEEKLARDVYAAFYEQWGLAIFSNIARSEQTHMDAIKVLLDRYDLADPVAGREAGEFDNQQLGALYDQLVLQGEQSLVEALRVGAMVEEIDILDLEERLAGTDHPALEQLYGNLLRGSENHLRAFASLLDRQGTPYEPSYLGADAYAQILAGASSAGNAGASGAGMGAGRFGSRGGRGRP